VTEAQLQDAIRELAQIRGWLFFHPYDSRRSTPGWPDLFLVHPRTGDVVVAELKSTSGRVSQAQQTWIDAFAAAGVVVNVWRPTHLTGGQIARALTPSDVRSPSADPSLATGRTRP
jgi:hypothetical protein